MPRHRNAKKKEHQAQPDADTGTTPQKNRGRDNDHAINHTKKN